MCSLFFYTKNQINYGELKLSFIFERLGNEIKFRAETYCEHNATAWYYHKRGF